MRVWWDGMPASVCNEIIAHGLSLDLLQAPEAPISAAHIFIIDWPDLEAKLQQLLPMLEPAGFVWVSWPKKAARVPTGITEDVVRAIALPMHLVDVKVCAVDDIWSGLKLVIRKEHR